MIRINLLGGPQKKRRGGGGLQLPDFSDLVAKVKDPLLIGAVVSWAVVLLVVGLVWVTQAASLGELRERHSSVQNEARRFRNLIAQKRRARDTRDSLVAELTAIREIDADRYVWSHVLEEVTKALPDFTWLVAMEPLAAPMADLADSAAPPPPVQFQIDGRTSDLSAYTRFVSQLTQSPWVGRAEFGAVQSVIEEERPIQAFTVTVTYRTADSAFIRTVPLTASVR